MMTKSIRSALLGAALWLVMPSGALPADSQKPYVSSPRRALTAPELLDAPDEWIERSLGWAAGVLDQFPPALIENPVRRAALIRLDDILHIESAPSKPLVQNFYHARMEKAVQEIERTPVKEGMRIWKLYNHGFFIRTPAVSFTIDIVPGMNAKGFPVSPRLLERLADQSDATLITHLHGDHANPEVARMFIARNKPVVAPEGLWSQHPELAKRLTYPQRSVTMLHEIPVQNGKQALKLVVYPGHQGDLINNVYLITTPEGFTVLHTGDQSGPEGPGSDFDWIVHIGHQHHVDVALPNCWTTNIQRLARGVNPRLIITGHENEMGHTVDHREDYTQTYNHLFGTPYPFIVMAWGETYLYRK